MPDIKIGKVTHYYDKVEVAVVDLINKLTLGDKIKFVKDDKEYSQTVSSMQIEHEQVKLAKKGQSIGLKVVQPIPKHSIVFRLS